MCHSRLRRSHIRHVTTNYRKLRQDDLSVSPSGTMLISSFVQICELVQKLKWGKKTHTHIHTQHGNHQGQHFSVLGSKVR
jgi:hypothetical protein